MSDLQGKLSQADKDWLAEFAGGRPADHGDVLIKLLQEQKKADDD